MYNLDHQFELVKNEGKAKETILCRSGNKFLLNELKAELIKLHNRNKYIVRPEVMHITTAKLSGSLEKHQNQHITNTN